jgi:hypothetical protein
VKKLLSYASLLIFFAVSVVAANFFGVVSVSGMDGMPTYAERKRVRDVELRKQNIRNGLTPEGREKEPANADNERRERAMRQGGGVQ